VEPALVDERRRLVAAEHRELATDDNVRKAEAAYKRALQNTSSYAHPPSARARPLHRGTETQRARGLRSRAIGGTLAACT
jgi:hypothetical protein